MPMNTPSAHRIALLPDLCPPELTPGSRDGTQSALRTPKFMYSKTDIIRKKATAQTAWTR